MCFGGQATLPINTGHNTHKRDGENLQEQFCTIEWNTKKKPKEKTLNPSLPEGSRQVPLAIFQQLSPHQTVPLTVVTLGFFSLSRQPKPFLFLLTGLSSPSQGETAPSLWKQNQHLPFPVVGPCFVIFAPKASRPRPSSGRRSPSRPRQRRRPLTQETSPTAIPFFLRPNTKATPAVFFPIFSRPHCAAASHSPPSTGWAITLLRSSQQ